MPDGPRPFGTQLEAPWVESKKKGCTRTMNYVTFVGNLLADPELKFGDTPRVTFRVAVNEGSKKRGNEKMHAIRVTAFNSQYDSLAENINETLRKGDKVVVAGRLSQFNTDVEIDGKEVTLDRLSVIANSVGVELSRATADITRNPKKDYDGDDDDRGSRGNDRGGERSERSERGSDSRSSRKSEKSGRSNKGDDENDF